MPSQIIYEFENNHASNFHDISYKVRQERYTTDKMKVRVDIAIDDIRMNYDLSINNLWELEEIKDGPHMYINNKDVSFYNAIEEENVEDNSFILESQFTPQCNYKRSWSYLRLGVSKNERLNYWEKCYCEEEKQPYKIPFQAIIAEYSKKEFDSSQPIRKVEYIFKYPKYEVIIKKITINVGNDLKNKYRVLFKNLVSNTSTEFNMEVGKPWVPEIEKCSEHYSYERFIARVFDSNGCCLNSKSSTLLDGLEGFVRKNSDNYVAIERLDEWRCYEEDTNIVELLMKEQHKESNIEKEYEEYSICDLFCYQLIYGFEPVNENGIRKYEVTSGYSHDLPSKWAMGYK